MSFPVRRAVTHCSNTRKIDGRSGINATPSRASFHWSRKDVCPWGFACSSTETITTRRRVAFQPNNPLARKTANVWLALDQDRSGPLAAWAENGDCRDSSYYQRDDLQQIIQGADQHSMVPCDPNQQLCFREAVIIQTRPDANQVLPRGCR